MGRDTDDHALDWLFDDTDGLYTVTLLKREPKDFSLNQVRQEIRHAAQLRPLYHIGMRIMPKLDISAALRSGIARLFVSIYSTRMRGGYMRFQAQYLRRIRVPFWHVEANGLSHAAIHQRKGVLTLPGYFRPTKLWDLLITNEGRLVAALELKSHVGPSFGNNAILRTG